MTKFIIVEYVNFVKFSGLLKIHELYEPNFQYQHIVRFASRPPLGVVHKLRLQDEVGRWSKNVPFLSTFIP